MNFNGSEQGKFMVQEEGLSVFHQKLHNKNNHYLIDTGAPYTFLSKEVLKALKCDETQNKFGVYINTHSIPVRLSTRHFEGINLLGMDYLERQ